MVNSNKNVKKSNILNNIFNKSIINLIKIAQNLDDNGECSSAEEIHKFIRKYQNRI